ncbi:MAG TPA: hypothetical protein VEW92_10330 [Nitrososphaeraceae archaeon]|nr:hypothetical protein [Nitrososphaeraceae archaeon]
MNNLIDYNEWRNNSMKGIVCGVLLCRNSPINQCPRCFLHYCSEHVKSHFHIDTPKDIEKRREDTEKLR